MWCPSHDVNKVPFESTLLHFIYILAGNLHTAGSKAVQSTELHMLSNAPGACVGVCIDASPKSQSQ